MKDKGFTLVELLAIIVLLSIVTGVAVVSVTSLINNNKKKTSYLAAKEITEQAEAYNWGNSVCISVQDLMSAELVDESSINPRTNDSSWEEGEKANTMICKSSDFELQTDYDPVKAQYKPESTISLEAENSDATSTEEPTTEEENIKYYKAYEFDMYAYIFDEEFSDSDKLLTINYDNPHSEVEEEPEYASEDEVEDDYEKVLDELESKPEVTLPNTAMSANGVSYNLETGVLQVGAEKFHILKDLPTILYVLPYYNLDYVNNKQYTGVSPDSGKTSFHDGNQTWSKSESEKLRVVTTYKMDKLYSYGEAYKLKIESESKLKVTNVSISHGMLINLLKWCTEDNNTLNCSNIPSYAANDTYWTISTSGDGKEIIAITNSNNKHTISLDYETSDVAGVRPIFLIQKNSLPK